MRRGTHLFLLDSFLSAPSVGVKPEELLLSLLVTHHLLRPGGGAAHEAGHGAGAPGLLGLHHSGAGVGASGVAGRGSIGLSHWLGRHAGCDESCHDTRHVSRGLTHCHAEVSGYYHSPTDTVKKAKMLSASAWADSTWVLAVNRQQSYISHSPALELGRVRARCGVRGSGEQRVSSEVTQVRGRPGQVGARGPAQLVTRHPGHMVTPGTLGTWSPLTSHQRSDTRGQTRPQFYKRFECMDQTGRSVLPHADSLTWPGREINTPTLISTHTHSSQDTIQIRHLIVMFLLNNCYGQ